MPRCSPANSTPTPTAISRRTTTYTPASTEFMPVAMCRTGGTAKPSRRREPAAWLRSRRRDSWKSTEVENCHAAGRECKYHSHPRSIIDRVWMTAGNQRPTSRCLTQIVSRPGLLAEVWLYDRSLCLVLCSLRQPYCAAVFSALPHHLQPEFCGCAAAIGSRF